MRCSPATWLLILGSSWALVGFGLFWKGLSYAPPLLYLLSGCSIGFLKGTFVLARTVQKTYFHLHSLSAPIHVRNALKPTYLLLIAAMMGLGAFFRWIELPLHVRSLIDVAVGTALLIGAIRFFLVSRHSSIPKPD